VSKHGLHPGALHISGNGLPGSTTVELDGEDITSTLKGLSLRLSTEDQPTATLDVLLWETSTDLENPAIIVPDKTRELLVSLGWTPPQGDEPEGGGNS
jgi:phage protein D